MSFYIQSTYVLRKYVNIAFKNLTVKFMFTNERQEVTGLEVEK